MEPYSTHKHLWRAHKHTHIYAHIFGITTSRVTGFAGWQTLSYGRLTSELLFQTHLPSRHNMPSSISSHLFPSRASQWAFMDHFHHTKPTFVHHSHFREESICIFFFCKERLWCVDVSTGIGVFQGSQTSLHASRVTGPLLFCILCNSACQLGKMDGSKIFKCNKSNRRETTYV